VAKRYAEFWALGVGLGAVSMTTPEGLFRYLAEWPLPFPLLADPDRRAYAAFGLERTTWGKVIRPGTMWRYTKAVLRGGKVRPVPKGEDPLQTGGDFLIGADRRVLWGHTTPDPTGRPTVDFILRACGEQLAAKANRLELKPASGENPLSPTTTPG
jgi:AhpC/TSA antioxidant enzyme